MYGLRFKPYTCDGFGGCCDRGLAVNIKNPRCAWRGGDLSFLEREFLLTQTERLDDVAVAFDVAALEVVEQSAALTYELNERAFCSMIFTVGSHVVRQMGNTVRKQSQIGRAHV